MHHKFPQSSTILRVFALILTSWLCAVAAMAQENVTAIAPKIVDKVPAAGKTAVVAGHPSSEKETANDYQSSLTVLSTLYQNEVARLEKQNNQSKELYKDGLI